MFGFFRAAANRRLVDRLHGEIVAAARQPALYARLGAPDTFEGRFELLALHAGAVLRRLETLGKAGDAAAADLARDLADAIFLRLDHTLREQGVGDLAVPKRMKKFAEAFYGRLAACEKAMADGTGDALRLVVARNVLADESATEAAGPLATYLRRLWSAMDGLSFEAMTAGAIPFPGIETSQPAGAQS